MNKVFALVVGLFVLLIGGIIAYMMAGQKLGGPPAVDRDLQSFAAKYTEAWNSRQPTLVAHFYAEDGSLAVNDAPPAVGRAAIAEVAAGFMTAFPDMRVSMDDLEVSGNEAVYRWTFVGTNSGPGGTGNTVRFSGHELWVIDSSGLIRRSRGHFDAADYERQLAHGVALDQE